MAKPLEWLVRKTVLAKRGHLITLDDPFAVMADLVQGHPVTGILDAGASDGRITRRLLARFPTAQAYLFEPNPSYQPALQRYAQKDPRVHPQAAALWNRAGHLDLQIAQSAGITSAYAPNARSHRLNGPAAETVQILSVPCTTLDAWRQKAGNPRLEVLKFDIQAAELQALYGAAVTLADTALLVYTEVFFNPMYEGGGLFADIDAQLRASGFALYNFFGPRAPGGGTGAGQPSAGGSKKGTGKGSRGGRASRGLLLSANALYVHAEKLGF